MTGLLDTARWNVRPLARRFWLFRLSPTRSYGPQPVKGDELVPAAAFDKAVNVLEQISTGEIIGGSAAETLAYARQVAGDALKDLSA